MELTINLNLRITGDPDVVQLAKRLVTTPPPDDESGSQGAGYTPSRIHMRRPEHRRPPAEEGVPSGLAAPALSDTSPLDPAAVCGTGLPTPAPRTVRHELRHVVSELTGDDAIRRPEPARQYVPLAQWAHEHGVPLTTATEWADRGHLAGARRMGKGYQVPPLTQVPE